MNIIPGLSIRLFSALLRIEKRPDGASCTEPAKSDNRGCYLWQGNTDTQELLPQIKEMLAKGMMQEQVEDALGLSGYRPVHGLLKR